MELEYTMGTAAFLQHPRFCVNEEGFVAYDWS